MTQTLSPIIEADVEEDHSPTAPALPAAPGTPTISHGTPVDVAIPVPVKTVPGHPRVPRELAGWYDKLEAFVSRLSVRDNFWRSVCSLIWLPLAFFSGLKMKELDADTFAAVLPFRRFNRNWYRAMAGGALLANSEIAGGAYLFGICGGDYTVVCKNLNYTFLRPCYGPALYRITSRQNLRELIASNAEFNINIDMEVLQQAGRIGEKDKRVGKCDATFHITPKVHHKNKAGRKKK